jgi:ABC-type bacteriocin/lantibiotic exporter with double-glycine peptidase domain
MSRTYSRIVKVISGLLAWVCLALLPIGCASAPIHDLGDPEIQPRLKDFTVIDVKYKPQVVSTMCGLANISSVLEVWGVNADQSTILHVHPPRAPERGYSLGELQKIAQADGLKAYSLKEDEAFLDRQVAAGRPVIVALGDDPTSETEKITGIGSRPFHSVTICGSSKSQYLVMDPRGGFLIVEREALERAWKETDYSCLLVAH